MPPLDVRFEILVDHARRFEAACGQDQFRRMRKHLGWYCKGFPHAASLRANMFRVSSVADLEQVLADFRVLCTDPTELPDQTLLESLVFTEPSPTL
jgi:tRNA-dihydrouridine synthase